MNITREFVRTVQPHNKDGVRMKRDTYSALKKFILDQFETENEITVNTLLHRGLEQFGKILGDLAAWHLYQVKLDLEARGLIKNVLSMVGGKKTVITRILPSKKVKYHRNLK